MFSSVYYIPPGPPGCKAGKDAEAGRSIDLFHLCPELAARDPEISLSHISLLTDIIFYTGIFYMSMDMSAGGS
jgi:hypothetical protein